MSIGYGVSVTRHSLLHGYKLCPTGVIAMQCLSLTFHECMQSLPQRVARKKIKVYTHTAFLKIVRVVHE